MDSLDAAAASVVDFIAQHQVTRLNVAGPRASQEPEITAFVDDLFTATFCREVIGRR
jgi:hypothetical protein